MLEALQIRRSPISYKLFLRNGGAEGSRTPDLLIANEALYQLSYGPRKARNNPFAAFPVKRPFGGGKGLRLGGAAKAR